MKRNLFQALVAIQILAGSAFAQFPNPLDYNTATNANNTGTLSVGTDDLHWTVALTNSVGPFVPAKSCGKVYSGYASSPFPNANWISYPHTCTPGDWAEHSCHNPLDLNMFYRILISLPANNCSQSISTPSAYCLSFDFFADNTVWAITVNGVNNYQNNTSNPYGSIDFQPGQNKTVSLCNGWVAGTNTVLVHIKSGQGGTPAWEAFLAQANQTVNPNTGSVMMNASSTQTNITCFGMNNGSASVSVSGNGPFTYSWSPAGGTGPLATGLTAGIYSVLITNTVPCSVTKTVSITQPAPLAIGVSTAAPRCKGVQLSFTATGAPNFTWQPGSLTGTTVLVSPTVTTTYSITGNNGNGCAYTHTFSQVVLDCSGIDGQDLSGTVVFYPNPVRDRISVTGHAEKIRCVIIDIRGSIVLDGTLQKEQTDIDVSLIKPGIYFMRVISGNNTVTRKILKLPEN